LRFSRGALAPAAFRFSRGAPASARALPAPALCDPAAFRFSMGAPAPAALTFSMGAPAPARAPPVPGRAPPVPGRAPPVPGRAPPQSFRTPCRLCFLVASAHRGTMLRILTGDTLRLSSTCNTASQLYFQGLNSPWTLCTMLQTYLSYT
jgi:hypothetical protein